MPEVDWFDRRLILGWVTNKNKVVGIVVGKWYVRRITHNEKIEVLFRRATRR